MAGVLGQHLEPEEVAAGEFRSIHGTEKCCGQDLRHQLCGGLPGLFVRVEDSTVGVKTAELLMFNTSGDEQICLKEHVDRMKEGQNDIWHITGESITVVSSSPFEENLRRKGLEVLYMVDPVDEYAVQQLKEFDGKKP